jgi:hypothetical protein
VAVAVVLFVIRERIYSIPSIPSIKSNKKHDFLFNEQKRHLYGF